MRILLGSGTLFLAASASLLAQSQSPSSALMMQQPFSQNCPVTLRAEHVPGSALSRAEDAKHPGSKPLHILFKPTGEAGVAQAEVVLHGMSGTHVLPAGSRERPSTTEAFSVSPTRASGQLFDTVVYVQKLTAVGYLELISMKFSNGTVWHASATSTCRVAPDGFMPVTAGK